MKKPGLCTRGIALLTALVVLASLLPSTALASGGGTEAAEEGYYLMNIPSGDFYAGEQGEGQNMNVDAVTAATSGKFNGALATGSYHEREGEITGVIYPVKVSSSVASFLEGRTEVQAAGEEEARAALFDKPSYSFWKMTQPPSSWKELLSADPVSFGAVTAQAEELSGVEATLNTNDHHVDYAITVKGAEGISADNVSAATLTTEDGAVYGLRHVYGIWRGTSLGFNVSQEGKAEHFPDLVGKTVTRLTWYLTDGSVLSAAVNLKILPKAQVTAAVKGVDAGSASTTFTLSAPLPEGFAASCSVADASGTAVSGVTASLSGTEGTVTGLESLPFGSYGLTITDTSGTYSPIQASFSLYGYVLMNVPYEQFYAAVGATDGEIAYDTITSATNKVGNYGKSGGAFHSGKSAETAADGTITPVGGANGVKNEGVIWPVQVGDAGILDSLKGEQLTGESTVTTATMGRGQTSISYLVSYEALTEAPPYSYCVLPEKPVNYLTVSSGHGRTSFAQGAESPLAGEAELTARYGTNWGDVQLSIGGVEELSSMLINAVVITARDADGTEVHVPFFHLTNVWSPTEMAWKAAQIRGLDGRTITDITYYSSVKDDSVGEDNDSAPPYSNAVWTCTVKGGFPVPPVYGGVTADFSGSSSISLSDLPADVKNLQAKVYVPGERGQNGTYLTPLGVDPADDEIEALSETVQVSGTEGTIPISPDLKTVTNSKGESRTYGQPVSGTEYTIELSSDNYILQKTTATFCASPSGNEPGEEDPGEKPGEGDPGDEPGEEDPGDEPGDEPGEEDPGEEPGEEDPGEEPGEEEPGSKPGDTPGGSTAKPGTTTTLRPDGSTTTTVTREDGSVTETTVTKAGVTGTVEKNAAGTVTSGTVMIPSGSVNPGERVAAPIEVPVASDTGSAPPIEIRNGTGSPCQVELPAAGAECATTAVLVGGAGGEETVRDCIVTGSGVVLTVEGTVTVKLVNRAVAFTDVLSSSAWASDAVDFVSARELFQGTGGTQFSPTVPMSRAMLVTALYRLVQEPEAEAPDFPDVPRNSWYARAVAWASETGRAEGYDSGRFGPDDPITREQMVTFLFRHTSSAGLNPEGSGDLTGFADADQVSPYAREAMTWAVRTGRVTGVAAGRVAPGAGASRAEAAAILMRYCANILHAQT